MAYAGDGTFAGSTSPVLAEGVGSAGLTNTFVTLVSSASPAAPGQALTFTATVSAAGSGTPTGTVTFYDGGNMLGTGTLALVNGLDQAAFTTSVLAAGTHSLSAVYGGDTSFAGSSATLSQAIGRSTTAGTFISLASSADTTAPGQALTLTATVSAAGDNSPGGTVTFYDGATVLGTASLAPTTPDTADAGNLPGLWQAQAAFTTSVLAAGSHSLSAVYGGSSLSSGSTSAAVAQTVQAVATTTTLTTSATEPTPGQSVTLTATVTGGGGGTPTGSVTFYDGTTVLGSGVLTAGLLGTQAVLTTSTLVAGSHSLSAAYNGDNSYSGSTSAAVTATVQLVGTSTALAASSDTPITGEDLTLTATVSGGGSDAMPTGTVTFYDGSTVLGTGVLSTATGQDQATFTTSPLAAGSHSLSAVYGGDSTFASSTADVLSETVTQSVAVPTSISLTADPSTITVGSPVAFTAVVLGSGNNTPTGTVTFYDGGNVLGTAQLGPVPEAVWGAQALYSTFTLTVGTHSITAAYGGDSSDAPSTSDAVTVTVQALSTTPNPDLGGPGLGGEPDTAEDDGWEAAFAQQADGLTGPTGQPTAAPTSPYGAPAGAPDNSSLSEEDPALDAALGLTTAATGGTPATGSNPTAVVPPQGPGASGPGASGAGAVTNLVGTYGKSYTFRGSNDEAAYYLSVNLESTFGASGETGTITVTAWLEDNGIFLLDEQNVVEPFTNPAVYAGGTDFGNLPGTGLITEETPADFGLDDYTWDDQHFTLLASYDATGSYTDANGVTYSTKQDASATSRWDSARTFVDDGSGTDSGKGSYSTQFGGTWSNDVLASDQTANFPTRPAYDANGNPASLTAAPVAGTTFLTESFDAGSSSGSADTTWAVADGQDDELVSSALHSSYTGQRGARYNYANTVAVADASGANSDTVTWQVSRLSTGSYGGGQDADLTYSGDAQDGTASVRSNANGQSTVSATLTDAYARTGRTKQADGTLQVSTADLAPSTYNAQQAEKQVYTGGVLTADTLSSSAATSSLTTQSLNDSWDFTARVLKEDGSLLGTTVGTQYSGSAGTAQAQASAATTLNLLDNTATVNSSSSSSDAGWTMNAASGTYTAADGSVTQAASWVRATQGFSSASANAQGDLNAEGVQTSGTLATQSQDGGLVYGFSTQLYQGAGWPTLYTVQTTHGGYADGGSSDLTANSDGSANGTVQAGSASTTVIDTTSTMTGTQPLADGTAVYDNYNHTKETLALSSRADLFMSSGLPTGTTTQEADDINSLDYRIKVKIDRTGDKLHATLKASGSGSNESDDTVTAAYGSGTPTLSRTFVFSQKGATESNLSASGKLSDSAGHTGSWSLEQSASGSTDDRVDVDLGQGAQGWVETGRTFRINDQSGSSSSFSESDDGLGKPAFPAGQIGGFTHTNNANSESAATVIRNGTSASYTFTTNRRGSQTQQDSTSWAWLNPATGDGGSKQTFSSSTRAFRNNVTGTDTGGQRSLTSRDTYTHAEDLTRSHLVYFVANQLRLEVTQSRLVDVTEQRRGSAASGTGTRRLYVSNLNKISSYVEGEWRTTGAEPQTQSSVLDLSWPNGQSPTTVGVLWEDFKADPVGGALVKAGNWVWDNGWNLGRIAIGVVEVLSGAAALLGTGGLAAVPGVGLMALGVDQILTGALNIANPELQAGSAAEFGAYSLARSQGFSEQASQVIGTLTPLALSMAFGGWAALGRGWTRSRRIIWDSRDFRRVISPEYWAARGGAHGRSLHHWLFPQRAGWVPLGLRNAGFNLVVIPSWPRVHGWMNLNTWMGFTTRWPWRTRWGQKVAAMALENSIRVAIPASLVGGGFLGYYLGGYLAQWLNEP